MDELGLDKDTLIAYGSMLLLAVLPIVAGAYKALYTPPDEMELLESGDAWLFPFVGSSVLFGLYVLFNIFSKEWLNYLLSFYFLLFGVGALAATLIDIASLLFKSKKQASDGESSKALFKLWKWEPTAVDLAATVPAIGVAVWYMLTKHWLANNVFGLAFCVQGIALISLSFRTGTILLWGLFIYDIFWVFGTDVMVTVATSFDAPIKLVFPKNAIAALLGGADFQFSMLGLGDIVLPGMFLAMLLRFDAARQNIDVTAERVPYFSKQYWRTGFCAYVFGLVTTIVVMHTFKHAQPALLYLVPSVTLLPLLTALSRSEFEVLTSFSEDALIKAAKERLEQKEKDKETQAAAEQDGEEINKKDN
jgi:minor histocompatibility antigen H13